MARLGPSERVGPTESAGGMQQGGEAGEVTRPVGAVDARFTLAAERTLLAWIRTSLGFMAAGIAVIYLAPDVDDPILDLALGLVMVVLGCGLALVGAVRWRRTTHALTNGGEMPGPAQLMFVVAAIVGVAILLAIVVVVQA